MDLHIYVAIFLVAFAILGVLNAFLCYIFPAIIRNIVTTLAVISAILAIVFAFLADSQNKAIPEQAMEETVIESQAYT